MPLAGTFEQVLVSANPAVAVTALTFRATLPVLVTVTVWGVLVDPTAVLAKARLKGLKVPVVTKPLPESATVSGLSGASSVKLRLPVRTPPMVGVTVTRIWQLDPKTRAAGQLEVSAKLVLAVMLLIFSVALPVFERVTVCAALVWLTGKLAKVRLWELRVTMGDEPSPTMLMKCGEPAALSPSRMDPTREPGAVGVNVAVKVQKAPAATLVPQSSVSVKSPVMDFVAIVRGAVPMLRRMVERGGLATPTLRVENCSKDGPIATAAALA